MYILEFMLAALLVELTPGPNMAYLGVVTVHRGARAGLAVVAGVAVGLLIVGVLSALGLAALIASSPVLFQTLRWVGGFYLLWLAFQIWRVDADAQTSEPAPKESRRALFGQGVIVNVLNPKIYLFYITVIPAFLGGAWRDDLHPYFSLMFIYAGVATCVHLVIIALAEQGRFHLTVRPLFRRYYARAMAILMALVAGWLIWAMG